MSALGLIISVLLVLRVVGGSMQPTLRDGDTIAVHPVPFDALRVGDVVVFRAPDGRRTVHRIREIRQGKLWTKGDANARRDAFWVYPTQVLGKVDLAP